MKNIRKRALHPYIAVAWKIAKQYDACFAAVQREYGLTSNERDVLLFLHNNKRYDTAADIVKYRSISKSLVSKSVESLSKRELLHLHQGLGDRRQVHLCISDKAQEIVERLAETQRIFFKMIGQGITKEEYGVFHDVLKKWAIMQTVIPGKSEDIATK